MTYKYAPKNSHETSMQVRLTPLLNRAQVKNKCRDKISMVFFMSDQGDFKYVKIKTFHLNTVLRRKLIFVTNG